MSSRAQRVTNLNILATAMRADLSAIRAAGIGNVRSVQSGGFAVAGAATINAVVVAKSSIKSVSKGADVFQFSAVLTNTTTVTADGPCEWVLTEYY
jgi:hypothetical protein